MLFLVNRLDVWERMNIHFLVDVYANQEDHLLL